MRRKDKQIQDLELLHEVINNAKVCRMGLVNDSFPYVLPLSFGFDGENFYFHSATAGEKVEILKKNNNVCLEFEQDIAIIEDEKPCKWSAYYLTVVVHGTADLVVDSKEKNYGLNQIIAHYRAGAPKYLFTEQELKSVLVYRVTPKQIICKKSGVVI